MVNVWVKSGRVVYATQLCTADEVTVTVHREPNCAGQLGRRARRSAGRVRSRFVAIYRLSLIG